MCGFIINDIVDYFDIIVVFSSHILFFEGLLNWVGIFGAEEAVGAGLVENG